MNILIVKHGALGDVVRTSYFAAPLRRKHGSDLKLFWITAPVAVPLIVNNPHIHCIATRFDDIIGEKFDVVYSLDDEEEILARVAALQVRRLVGAYIQEGRILYSPDSAVWFDMGLRSRFGKTRADELKKLNLLGHAEIFAQMFCVPCAEPHLYGDPDLETQYAAWLTDPAFAVGINPFAGGRWPSKELQWSELIAFLRSLLGPQSPLPPTASIVLIGAGGDRTKNHLLQRLFADPRLLVSDTDASPLHLAGLIHHLDCLVSSDSLAMHLAIAQNVPTVAFFSPTSAAEIDDFGRVLKIASTAPDYCSYRPDADNTTITHERLLEALAQLYQRYAKNRRTLGDPYGR